MGKTIAAGIFIIKKDGNLLVCHPTNHKADFWSIPKGKVEEGETMLEAAIRETYEETNLDLTDSHDFDIYELNPVNYGHRKKIIHPFLFLESVKSTIDWKTTEIKCNSNVPIERGGFPEMDDYKWVSLDDARSILHETQVACIDRILELTRKLNNFYNV